MKIFARTAALGTMAFIVVLVFGAGPASAQNKCLAGKTTCVNKKMSALLKCHIAAEKGGLPVDPACIGKATGKFDGGTKGVAGSCFGKLEIKNDGPCVTSGDLGVQEAKVDAFVLDVVQEVDPNYPGVTLNTCSAGKKKCVLKKAAGKLKCYEKCQKDPAKCGTVLTECLDKAEGKFDGAGNPANGCFAKLEAKGGCLTLSDANALEDKVEAFILDVLSELQPGGGPCSGGSPFPVCNGTCPAGHVCSAISGTTSCECVGGGVSCNYLGAPQCGGDCPVNQSCAFSGPIFCFCQ